MIIIIREKVIKRLESRRGKHSFLFKCLTSKTRYSTSIKKLEVKLQEVKNES